MRNLDNSVVSGPMTPWCLSKASGFLWKKSLGIVPKRDSQNKACPLWPNNKTTEKQYTLVFFKNQFFCSVVVLHSMAPQDLVKSFSWCCEVRGVMLSFLQCAAIMEVIYRAIGADRSVVSSDAMDWQGSVQELPSVYITFLAWGIASMLRSLDSLDNLI
ncbi:very-long-chain (3R)-3-hydroxyacyl-CoA dehydratase [Trifolium repens]|nr:very-long-chain (3R)-3-hydroxyacyl-CoA dehydratase [Trifolium repens]